MLFKNKLYSLIFAAFLVFGFGLTAKQANAAMLSVNPPAGTFSVGSTFDVPVYLDTEGASVNALEVGILFPPDKLQLVSPASGRSVIAVWTAQPAYNNQSGTVTLEGGMPGGINVSNGLVTTLTFRVKSVGTAIVRFSDDTRVLLNDGNGTDALRQSNSAIYQLVLPPPAGPVVISETHADQSKWYSNRNVALSWASDEAVKGFSYMLTSEPVDIPDDISEGDRVGVSYANTSDGQLYFHIKALRNGSWGGTTHFAVSIDGTPPADFPIEIIPKARTTTRQPVVKFGTTDALSGINRYEVKAIPLSVLAEGSDAQSPIFIEIQNPYILHELDLGKYDVILRAYDNAGNFREVTKTLNIVKPVFQFINDKGVDLQPLGLIPWNWFWFGTFSILLLLLLLAWHYRRAHLRIHEQRTSAQMPGHLQQQLDELQKYRAKYGNIVPMFALVAVGLLFSLFFGAMESKAQDEDLTPPLITTISGHISDEEIFYVGGRTDEPNTDVLVFLQNTDSGETFRQVTISDKRNEWFYRHGNFLPSGNYIIWAQSRSGGELSAPSPQQTIEVRTTALQFGGARLSREVLYLLLMALSLLVVIALILYIVVHSTQARRKRKAFLAELNRAEESIKRGFAVLRRDIELELKSLRARDLLSEEDRAREGALVEDLDVVERRVGEEIWQVEHQQ